MNKVNLYKLPKDILVQLICTINEQAEDHIRTEIEKICKISGVSECINCFDYFTKEEMSPCVRCEDLFCDNCYFDEFVGCHMCEKKLCYDCISFCYGCSNYKCGRCDIMTKEGKRLICDQEEIHPNFCCHCYEGHKKEGWDRKLR